MLKTTFCGIEMKNPIVAASGTFGLGLEYQNFLNYEEEVGAISVKGLTLEPRHGNPGARIAETPSGILNSIGLENPGVDHFIKYILPSLKKKCVPILANISGKTVEEYGEMAKRFQGTGIAGVEVNISCPNVKNGGMAFGTSANVAAEITTLVKKHADVPVIMKLSPNVTDIVSIAKAVEDAGADGISMINTLLGMAINVKTWEPILGNVYGGLSGPAVKPVALRMVHQVTQKVRIPVMGMGGIMTGTDAIEFMLAGAQAVSVGVATMVTPDAIGRIAKEMEIYLQGRGLTSVQDVVGQLRIS